MLNEDAALPKIEAKASLPVHDEKKSDDMSQISRNSSQNSFLDESEKSKVSYILFE